MVLAPELWDCFLNHHITAFPRKRPAYSEGLHSCLASGEIGNYIKSVFMEQFVGFSWLNLSARAQAFAPGSVTSPPYGPNPFCDLAPLLPLCLSCMWKSQMFWGRKQHFILRGFQASTGWSPEQPGLFSEPTWCEQEVGAETSQAPSQRELSCGAVIHSK